MNVDRNIDASAIQDLRPLGHAWTDPVVGVTRHHDASARVSEPVAKHLSDVPVVPRLLVSRIRRSSGRVAGLDVVPIPDGMVDVGGIRPVAAVVARIDANRESFERATFAGFPKESCSRDPQRHGCRSSTKLSTSELAARFELTTQWPHADLAQ